MSKNIMIVTDYMASYGGNFIMSLTSLEKELVKDSSKVIYVFQKNAKDLEWVKEKTNVYFLDDSIIKNIKIISKIIKEEKINIIYTHFNLPKTQLAVKIAKVLNRKVKLISHFHNHFEDAKYIKKYLFRWIFKGNINIGCSKTVMESLPYKNKMYVNNGIDFKRLESYSNVNILNNNKFKILMFGYTYERKGVDLAIKSIKQINNKDIELYISVSKNLEQFKNKIINDFNEIPSFVHFLEPRDDIASYYKNVNLFISPSREEGLCYSPIEAMYCETPCICSNISGHPLDIPNLITFEKENVIELKEKIKYVMDNKIGDMKKSKKYIEETYYVQKWVKKIKDIINNI